MHLDHFIQTKKLIICCGSGGVGKTTTAASVGLKACLMGKKVLVLTIDPARRLANSLGLQSIGDQEKEIDPAIFKTFGLQAKGRLFAMMLDTKKTFDQIVTRYAPDEKSREEILSNPLYQKLSGMIAGSQEYMAMEKVYELIERKDYDLIILDTPPTQQAIDFLDAPNKMVLAVGESMLKWLLKPSLLLGKFSMKLFGRGVRRIFKAFDQVVGFDFLQDLSVMLISTAGLLEGFKQRAEKVSTLLKDPQTAFLLIAAPQSLSISEALFFYRKIQEYELPFGGFLLNRVHLEEPILKDPKQIRSFLGAFAWSEAEKQKMQQILNGHAMLAEQDCVQIKRLKDGLHAREPMVKIPALASDVHDLGGLAKIASYL